MITGTTVKAVPLVSYEVARDTQCVCSCSLNSHIARINYRENTMVVTGCGNCFCSCFIDRSKSKTRITDCNSCGYPFTTTVDSIYYTSGYCERCYH